jgi:hypothetical protein
MNGQTTIQNHIKLQHTLHMGLRDVRKRGKNENYK